MAQYKSGDPGVPPFVVENGSQTVIIPGVDARTDIPFSVDHPPYFREQETGPTYEVAGEPQYVDGDTVVTLTGAWQGDSGEIDGLFHVDFSANMGYPLFYSGDIDIPDILRRWVVGLDDDMYGLIVGAITDHNDLDGRDASGAHPISAISGLQAALDGKFDADGAHNDLSGRGDPDAHPIAAITGLQAALDEKFNQVDAGELAAGNDASDVPVSGLSAPFDSAENVEQALALLRSAAGRDVGTDPEQVPTNEMLITSVSVRAFGAEGDGVANDSQAFQDAIDHIEARGGGVVYIPPGVYNLLWTPMIGTGVHLVGAGRASRLTSNRSEAHALITNKGHTDAYGYDGAHSWSMSHFAVDSPNTNGICIVHARNAAVHHIHGLRAFHHFIDFAAVQDFYTHHLWLDGISGTAPYQIDGIPEGGSANARVDSSGDVIFPNNDGTWSDGVFLDTFSIRRETLEEETHGAIHFHRQGYRNVFISNGIIENYARAIRMDANRQTENISISNLVVRNPAESVVFFPNSSSRRVGLTFENITVEDVPSGGEVADRTLFNLRACDNVKFEGIRIEGAGGAVQDIFYFDDCGRALTVTGLHVRDLAYTVEDGHVLVTDADCDFESVDISDVRFEGHGRGIRIRPRADGNRHKRVSVRGVVADYAAGSKYYAVGVYSADVAEVVNCRLGFDAGADSANRGVVIGDEWDQVRIATVENVAVYNDGVRDGAQGVRSFGGASDVVVTVRSCYFENLDLAIWGGQGQFYAGANVYNGVRSESSGNVEHEVYVVESGSSGGVEWTKYSDGRMVVRGAITVSTVPDEIASVDLSLPQPFGSGVDGIAVTASPRTNSENHVWCHAYALSNVMIRIAMLRSNSFEVPVIWEATGRWQ